MDCLHHSHLFWNALVKRLLMESASPKRIQKSHSAQGCLCTRRGQCRKKADMKVDMEIWSRCSSWSTKWSIRICVAPNLRPKTTTKKFKKMSTQCTLTSDNVFSWRLLYRSCTSKESTTAFKKAYEVQRIICNGTASHWPCSAVRRQWKGQCAILMGSNFVWACYRYHWCVSWSMRFELKQSWVTLWYKPLKNIC